VAEEEAHGREAASYYYEVGLDEAVWKLVEVFDSDQSEWMSPWKCRFGAWDGWSRM